MKIKDWEKVMVVDVNGEVKPINFMVELSDIMELEEHLEIRKFEELRPGFTNRVNVYLHPGLASNQVSRAFEGVLKGFLDPGVVIKK